MNEENTPQAQTAVSLDASDDFKLGATEEEIMNEFGGTQTAEAYYAATPVFVMTKPDVKLSGMASYAARVPAGEC